MAWIELHQSLPTHRKTLEVMDELGIGTAQAVGHLACLWLWALDNAPNGCLAGVKERTIARASCWEGDAATFVAALKSAGFLDSAGLIHDWGRYAGRLLDQRQRNAEKQRAWRERQRNHGDVTATSPTTNEGSNRHVTVTSPTTNEGSNRHVTVTSRLRTAATGPDQTGPDQTSPPTGENRARAAPDANAPDAPPLQAVVNAWLEAIDRDPRKAKDYGRYTAVGAELVARGDSPEDVGNCTRWLRSEPWHQEHGKMPSLAAVRDALPSWIAKHRPATWREPPRRNGRASSVADLAASLLHGDTRGDDVNAIFRTEPTARSTDLPARHGPTHGSLPAPRRE